MSDNTTSITLDLDEETVQALIEYAVNHILTEEIKRRKTPALLQPKPNWRDNYNPC
jgi:hypothetical protein